MPTPEELAAQAAAEAAQSSDTESQAQSDESTKTASELERARREAANYRTKLRDLEGKWKEAEPVLAKFKELEDAQKSEAQKQADRIAQLEKQAADATASAQAAQRQAKLTVLATKANVDPELIALIDIAKLDLDDEAGTIKTLGKLAVGRQGGGSASNPGRDGGGGGKSDAELRQEIFGNRRTGTLFGRQ